MSKLSRRTVRRLGAAAVGVTGICLAGYAYRPRLRVAPAELGGGALRLGAVAAAGALSSWARGSDWEVAVLAALTDLCGSSDGRATLLAAGGIDLLAHIVDKGSDRSRALGLLARASTEEDGPGGPQFAALCAVLPPRTWASLSALQEPASAPFFSALEAALDADNLWAPAPVTPDLALTLALRPDPGHSDALRRVGARVLTVCAGVRGGEHARWWDRVAEEHTRSLAHRTQQAALDSGAEATRVQWQPSAIDSARLLSAMGAGGGARQVIVAAAAAALGQQGGADRAPLPAVSALCDAAAGLAPEAGTGGREERHLLGLLLLARVPEGEAGAAMLSWLRLTGAEESSRLEPAMHSLSMPLTGGVMPTPGAVALSLLQHAGSKLHGQGAERAEAVRYLIADGPGSTVQAPPITALPEPEALPSGGLTEEEASVALARPRTLRLHTLAAYMPLLSRVDSARARLGGVPLFTEFAPPGAPALHALVLPSRIDLLLSLTRCSDGRLVEEAALQLRAMLAQGGTTPAASLLAQRWLLSCVAIEIPPEELGPRAVSAAAPPPSVVAAAAATEATRWLQRECERAGGHSRASPWRRLPAHVRQLALAELRSAAGRGHLPPVSSDLLFPRTTHCARAIIHGAKALAWLSSGSAVLDDEETDEAVRVDEAEASAARVRTTLLRAGIEAPLLTLLRSVEVRAGRDETAACRQLCRLAANLRLSCAGDEREAEGTEAWTAVLASCMLHGDAKLRAQAWRAAVNRGLDGPKRPSHQYGDNLLPVLDASGAEEEAVPVDIVLVHGLQGASLRTWRASGVEPAAWLAAHPSWLSDATPRTGSVLPFRVGAPIDHGVCVPLKDNSRAALWPVLWLARDVARMRRGGEGPHFAPRVLAVSYDATLLAADCNRPHMELEVWAEVVARQLANAGVGAPGRRTVILAHSLGGILVKALACTEPGRQLLPSTDAVVFFGVPHRGSHVAAAFLSLTQAVDEAGRGGLRALASPHIGLLGSGEALARLNLAFAAALGAAQVLSFGEELRTPVTAALRVLIVPPHSADPGYGVYLTAPGTQHYDVCKPRSPGRGDALYEPLLAFIKRKLERRPLELVE
jgi:hypothetical protein